MKRIKLSGRIFGIVFLLAALMMLFGVLRTCYGAYVRRDWPETQAAVSDVDSYSVRRGTGRNSHRYTEYDYTYTYQVDGVSYSRRVTGSNRHPQETIMVKFDPQNPAESSTYLRLTAMDVVLPLGLAALFGFWGYGATGLRSWVKQKRAR